MNTSQSQKIKTKLQQIKQELEDLKKYNNKKNVAKFLQKSWGEVESIEELLIRKL